MNVKKQYYKLDTDEFNNYLENIKKKDSTIHFFEELGKDYFYDYDDHDNNGLILELHKKNIQLEFLYDHLNIPFQDMVIQTCLLEEIQSTNKIENISSTRNDIFEILKDVNRIHNKKIVSIVNVYNHLNNYEDLYLDEYTIRKIYDDMMSDAYLSSKDHLDGELYRKHPVYVSDGIKKVHTGFYPEEHIIKALNEFSDFNNQDIDIYLKIIIGHFLIETIHPCYDGNGRLGRTLMSIQLNNDHKTLLPYTLSTIINNHKSAYYKALEEGRDIHQFGCMNTYVKEMLKILIDGVDQKIKSLSTQINALNHINQLSLLSSKSHKKIYTLLYAASLLTYFGLSIEDLMKYTDVSKRTIMYTLKLLKENNLLTVVHFGKVNYYKINTEN